MKKLTYVLVLVPLLILGCSKEDKKEADKTAPEAKKEEVKTEAALENKPLALVDGVPIYQEDLHGGTLDKAVELELLYQEALRRGIDKNKEIEQRVKDFKKGLILRTFMDGIVSAEIDDAQIEAYYNEHPDEYVRIRVSEIAVKDKKVAEQIRQKLLSGEDVNKITEDYSSSITRARLTARHKDVFKGKEAGAVSDIIEDRGEFKVLKLLEKNEMPFEHVKNGIKYTLMHQKREEAVAELVEKLKKEKKVEILTQQQSQ